MYNAPYSKVADHLASFGRYGDSELVHLNPIEVQMLASLSPTGQLTVNPITGRKEAFLPFLAPLLGSFLGSSLLTGAGAGALGGLIGAGGLSSAAAGAIGSGLATAAATGDLEQGIMSGITGYGIGSALGAAGGAGNEAVKQATQNLTTQQAVQTTLDDATTKALTEATQKEVAARAAMPVDLAGPTAFSSELAGAPEMLGNLQNFPFAAQDPAYLQALSAQKAGQTSLEAARQGLQTAQGNIPISERLTAPFREPGAMLKQLTEPSSFLPIYVGETGRLQAELADQGRGSMREYEEQQAAERRKTLAQMGNVFNQVRQAYPGVGYAQGGYVDSYAVGGGIENAIRQAAIRGGYEGEYGDFSGSLPYNIPDPKNVQLSLRGSEYVPPPAASYAALDVGGEGYLPGISGEFQYFREPAPETKPPVDGTPPGGTPPGGTPPGGKPPWWPPGAPWPPGSGTPPGTSPGGEPGGEPTDSAGPIAGGDTGAFNFEDFLSRFPIFSGLYGNPAAGPGAGVGAGPGAGPGPGGGAGPGPGAGVGTGVEREPVNEQDLMNQPTTSVFDPKLLEELLSKQFNPLQDRLSQIESRFGETTPASTPPAAAPIDFSSLENRFSGLEERLANLRPAAAPEFDYSKINIPNINLGGIEERLAAIEARKQPEFDYSRIPSYTPPDLSGLESRFGALENRLSNLPAPVVNAPNIDLSGLENRFAGLEERIGRIPTSQVNVPQIDLSPIQQQINQLQSGIGALQQRPQPTFDTSAFEKRLAEIEGRGTPQVSFDPVMERLAALEKLIASQRSGSPAGSQVSQEFGPLEDGGFAEGGMIDNNAGYMDQGNDIVEMTVAAIRGEIENADQIIRAFVEQYGPEVFMQLREQVLQDIVPGAQTEGMVEGMGGGQDDLVNGMIGTQRPVAVSPGEYIIPADAVALAGGGYSGDGAKFFDGLVDDIRQKTMGTTEQVRPYRRSN